MHANLKKLHLLGVCLCSLGTGTLLADWGEWYLGASGGATMATKTRNLTTASPSNQLKFKSGWCGSIACGQEINRWRIELEGSSRRNKIKTRTVNAIDYPGNGRIDYLAAMLNAYYDYPLTETFSAYLGVGGGYARAHLKCPDPIPTSGISANSNTFGYQLLAGVGYDINENITMSAGYRLFSTTRPKFTPQNLTNKTKFKAPVIHSVEVGVRYTF